MEAFNNLQSLASLSRSGIPSSPSASLSTASSLGKSQLWAVPQLDKWKLLPNGSIVGTVSNHPTIEDGDVITTSPVSSPDSAARNVIVETASGSKYKLLEPSNTGGGGGWMANADIQTAPNINGFSFPSMRSTLPFTGPSTAQSKSSSKDTKAAWREARERLKLTMQTIGPDGEYILAGKPVRSTSGKSNIWEGYRTNPEDNGLPTDEPPVCIKISTNYDAVSREYENYRKISFLGVARGRFVKCYEFFPVAAKEKKFANQCALVLEKGAQDLKSYLNNRGRLEGNELRDACASAAACVQALHGVKLVWTDLKTENFVVMPNGEVKGIDLESAMPIGDNPVDYSPEACPPEFAAAFLSGEGPYFELDYSYDIWSLGMLFMELAMGKGYFDGKNPVQITKSLRDIDEDIPLDDLDCDERLKDLIRRCLNRDPSRRPNMAQILLHPYFIVGPFSLFRNF